MLKPVKNMQGHKPRNGFRGWTYPVPEFDYTFNDDYQTVVDLIHHVRAFEKVNKLEPIEPLEDILEDYFCRTCAFYGQFCRDTTMREPVTIKDKIRRVIKGGKAVAKMKVKAVRESLKVLPLCEVQENINNCVGCDLNRYADSVGHEGVYVADVAAAYSVKNISEVEQQGHEKLGKCEGCGCLLKTKVFLHPENYAYALVETPHDLNRCLKATTGDGKVCWQVRNALTEEQLAEVAGKRSVTYADLKKWGYR